MEILQIFEKRCQKETGHVPIVGEWSVKDEKSIPRQSISFECGVFFCQMAERLSRQSRLDFNQTQMPTIRLQIIDQLVSGQIPISSLPKEVLSPPLSDSGIAPQKMGRFEMPSSERMKRLEIELRNLRAKFAAKEVELNELKVNATKQIDTTISIIRRET